VAALDRPNGLKKYPQGSINTISKYFSKTLCYQEFGEIFQKIVQFKLQIKKIPSFLSKND
jgi:hypothetical protein